MEIGGAVAPHQRRAASRRQRYRLVAEIEALLDGPATYLSLLFAAFLVAEIVLSVQGKEIPTVLTTTQLGIWAFFILHFLLGLVIAPDRLRHIRHNWLTALSLVVPFFRAFRALRVLRLARATNSLRVLAGFSRTARSLRRTLAWSRAGYAAALAIAAALLGSAAVFMFEADSPRSRLNTYEEALWWAAATLTTVGAEAEPVTLGGRVVGLILMLGGLVLLGYIAGFLGSLLFDRLRTRARSTERERAGPP